MSIVSHVSVGTSPEKLEEMILCYDAFLAELGAKRQMVVAKDGSKLENNTADFQNIVAVAWGKYYPEVWVQFPHDEKETASPGHGMHLAFHCSSQLQVQRVYQAAIEHGATDNGKPGPRPEYSDKYYGAFFKDPFGNKLEAVFFDMGLFNYCTTL